MTSRAHSTVFFSNRISFFIFSKNFHNVCLPPLLYTDFHLGWILSLKHSTLFLSAQMNSVKSSEYLQGNSFLSLHDAFALHLQDSPMESPDLWLWSLCHQSEWCRNCKNGRGWKSHMFFGSWFKQNSSSSSSNIKTYQGKKIEGRRKKAQQQGKKASRSVLQNRMVLLISSLHYSYPKDKADHSLQYPERWQEKAA